RATGERARCALLPGPVALLVLPARAAGTRIIAAHGRYRRGRAAHRTERAGHRRRRRDGSHRRAGRSRARAAPGEEVIRPARRGRWGRRRRLLLPRRLGAHLNLEKALGERGLDVVHQVLEHLVRFLLVLDQRILLTPPTVVD